MGATFGDEIAAMTQADPFLEATVWAPGEPSEGDGLLVKPEHRGEIEMQLRRQMELHLYRERKWPSPLIR